nr:uncharacterized mitochondrial protein AtMg00810-like [Tanacetum cinerariifolium]
LQISQNPRGIFINQSKYALESLKKYGFKSCEPVDTPMVEKSKLDEDKEGKVVDPSHYRVEIASIFNRYVNSATITTASMDHQSTTIETLKTNNNQGPLPLPPPLPTRPPVPPPRDLATGRLALLVLILGGIIYTTENIGHLAKIDAEDTESDKGGDEVSESEGESDEEETRQEEEESFDLIPRTPEGSKDESNDEKDQELRLSEEARIQKEEEADELYRNPDGPQESSSVSSLVTSMLNPTSDVHVESIFTTASSPIVSLQTPTPIMTPSTIATITTSGDAPIPSTIIPSIILENLPTFNSAFRFDERLRSLETTFSEYRQTNPFVDAVFFIPGIVHQYMTQQMTEAVREAVQIQTDRLQDLLQRENDEFLLNIDKNMKKIIKGQVKNQVKEQVSCILPRIEESVNATLEAEALVEAYDADKAILDTYGESTILKRRKEDDDQEGPSVGSDRGSKRQKEGGEHASASTPSETATGGAGRSTTGSQSRQLSVSESAFAEEPAQTTCQMEEPPHPAFETGADDQPIVQTSQHPEWFS